MLFNWLCTRTLPRMCETPCRMRLEGSTLKSALVIIHSLFTSLRSSVVWLSLFNSIWFFLLKLVRNVNLHFLVQPCWKTVKDNLYWRKIRHNKSVWKVWTHCWSSMLLAWPKVHYAQFVTVLKKLITVLSEVLNKMTAVRIPYLRMEHMAEILITCIKDQSQQYFFIYLLF